MDSARATLASSPSLRKHFAGMKGETEGLRGCSDVPLIFSPPVPQPSAALFVPLDAVATAVTL